MPHHKIDIGNSPEHLAMQLGLAIQRVEALARRLGGTDNPLASEIQAKVQEYCQTFGKSAAEPEPVEPIVYRAKPVSLVASRITGLGGYDANGGRPIKLDNGRSILATKDMLRGDPKAGDYYFIDDDGRAALMPAAQFQLKYSVEVA